MSDELELAAALRPVLTRLDYLLRRHVPSDVVSLAQGSVLTTLLDHGPLRMGELAERERTSQPTASGLVSRLRRAGLIESTPDPEDGRAQLIGISDLGRAHLAELERGIAESMAGLAGEVTAEEIEAIAAALPVLDRIVAAGPREAPAPQRGGGRARGLPPAEDSAEPEGDPAGAGG